MYLYINKLRIMSYIISIVLIVGVWYSLNFHWMNVHYSVPQSTYTASSEVFTPPPPAIEEDVLVEASAPPAPSLWDSLPNADNPYFNSILVPIVLYFLKKLIDLFFSFVSLKLMPKEST